VGESQSGEERCHGGTKHKGEKDTAETLSTLRSAEKRKINTEGTEVSRGRDPERQTGN
jgi:hypothetical protein